MQLTRVGPLDSKVTRPMLSGAEAEKQIGLQLLDCRYRILG